MSLFANAAKLPTNSTKVKSTDKDVVTLPGLEEIAKIDAMAKTFGSLYKEASGSLKDEVIGDLFYGQVLECGKVPENFKAEEGIATASIECHKRGENSPLTDEEDEILSNLGLVPERRVIKPELWAINPAYVSDKTMMTKVDKLLKGKVPEDFLAFQAEESKPVVTDELLAQACEMKRQLPKEVFGILTTLVIKPKLTVTDLEALFKDMKTLLGLDEKDEEVVQRSPVKRATRKAMVEASAKASKKKAVKA